LSPGLSLTLRPFPSFIATTLLERESHILRNAPRSSGAFLPEVAEILHPTYSTIAFPTTEMTIHLQEEPDPAVIFICNPLETLGVVIVIVNRIVHQDVVRGGRQGNQLVLPSSSIVRLLLPN